MRPVTAWSLGSGLTTGGGVWGLCSAFLVASQSHSQRGATHPTRQSTPESAGTQADQSKTTQRMASQNPA